jgi:hypothetical protein
MGHLWANHRRSLPRAMSSVEHLRAAFGLSRALDITADRITASAARRQEAGAKPATVNRELSALKRMFRLGQRAGKVDERPYIAMLQDNNVRKGILLGRPVGGRRPQLPADRRPVFETAYLTGWRVKSELLTLGSSSPTPLPEGGVLGEEPGEGSGGLLGASRTPGRDAAARGADALRPAARQAAAADHAETGR